MWQRVDLAVAAASSFLVDGGGSELIVLQHRGCVYFWFVQAAGGGKVLECVAAPS